MGSLTRFCIGTGHVSTQKRPAQPCGRASLFIFKPLVRRTVPVAGDTRRLPERAAVTQLLLRGRGRRRRGGAGPRGRGVIVVVISGHGNSSSSSSSNGSNASSTNTTNTNTSSANTSSSTTTSTTSTTNSTSRTISTRRSRSRSSTTRRSRSLRQSGHRVGHQEQRGQRRAKEFRFAHRINLVPGRETSPARYAHTGSTKQGKTHLFSRIAAKNALR